ncbi:MAG: hypothetical protein ACD_60C00119G0005 [uncultured bacterium]|nr:MAG: hypothetical protein ACD_60C00119G0005 [uncultured bacterium]
MLNSVDLSVILPAYLEAENLRLLLPRLHRVLIESSLSFEILVIDTMIAMDHTRDVCKENQAICINREKGNSFGEAICTGIRKSRGTYVIFMDADGSHEPEFIPHLLKHRTTHDIVIASRYIPGGVTENPWILIFMSHMLNKIYSFVLGIHCKDVSNSFKLYPGEMLRSLKLKCKNFDIVEEILFKLVRQYPCLQIKEVPFAFKKRMFGCTKRNLILFMITYTISLIRLRFFLA